MTSPNPSWTPGQKINSPVTEMTSIDPESASTKDLYKLLIGSVIHRPIAFVSTISKAGITNLAPFSFFNAVSSNPPCLMVAIGRKPNGEKKDTLVNIEETEEFVINSANGWLIEPLVHTAAAYPHGVSEIEKAGLTPLTSETVKAPRVKEAAVHFECKLIQKLELGEGQLGSTTLVIGKAQRIHIYSDAYSEGRVDSKLIDPVGRLGGLSYTSLGEVFDIPVPKI